MKGGTEPFKVYSQNVYLGGDTHPVFSLDFADLPAVTAATGAFWNQVRGSGASERAAGFVDEIAAHRPHLVGFEEVFQFAVLDAAAGGAAVDRVDLLAYIEDEIARRGLPYAVVRVQPNTSVTLPLSARLVLSATDRVAVLRRTDLEVTASAQGRYAAVFTRGPLVLERGWVRVSARHGDRAVHFVATHLETQRLPSVQARQAAELIEGVTAGLDGITLVTGDLNSDVANPGAPTWTPTYDAMIRAGFIDLFAARARDGDPGYTGCQATDLRNAESRLSERIDFVLARAAAHGDELSSRVQVDVVGAARGDRTHPSGLWRSDHAGLVAGIRLP